MTDTMLDGNAAAGLLSEIFAFDATMAMATCGACRRTAPLGTLHLYGGATGAVLRCARCDAVNIRVMRTQQAIHLDCSGMVKLEIAASAG